MKFLILFAGNTRFDSRSVKVIRAAANAGIQTTVCDIPEFLANSRFSIKWPFFLFKMLGYRLFYYWDGLICMDVFSVPGIFFFSRPILFDAREINDQVHSLINRSFRKRMVSWLENSAFKLSARQLTVNSYLESAFLNRYGKKCEIVLNLPDSKPVKTRAEARKELGLEPDTFFWVFQGNIQPGRGLESAVDFIRNRPESEKLLVVGPLIGVPKVQKDPRIVFTGRIPSENLLNITVAGNAGLMLIDTKSESYRNSLPNKFFEYLVAGLPVLTTPLPQAEVWINRFGCGVITTPENLVKDAGKLKSGYADFTLATERFNQEVSGSQQIHSLTLLLKEMGHPDTV